MSIKEEYLKAVKALLKQAKNATSGRDAQAFSNAAAGLITIPDGQIEYLSTIEEDHPNGKERH